jgi:hypothetical protein
MSHANAHSATHFHVNIGYHVNPIGPTPFGIQNESPHFEWRDSNMSRTTLLDVTHFRSKSVSVFLIIYCFSMTKNK